MSEKNTTENQMRITIIGRFVRLHDEEYIARSFEMLGHDVQRITDKTDKEIIKNIPGLGYRINTQER